MIGGLFERYGELERHYMHVVNQLFKMQIILDDNMARTIVLPWEKKKMEKEFHSEFMKFSYELFFYLTRLHYDYRAMTGHPLHNEETD